MEWLRQHPQALDSLTILDDLATLLATAQYRLGASNRWHRRVLSRGAQIVLKHWQPERGGKLPWVLEANRPTLRLLTSFVQEVTEDWEDAHMEPAVRLYLHMNPDDQHNFRGTFVNRLLAEGRDADVLACTKRIANDRSAGTRYGEVLALYRLGRLEEAKTCLDQAVAYLPLVPKYLLRERIRPPRKRLGGDASEKEQAWQYRQNMYTVWKETEGALDWLSRNARPVRRRSQSTPPEATDDAN